MGPIVDEVVAALEAGEVVALPTDTVYGLVARATDARATEAIFAIKGRGRSVPLAVLGADLTQAIDLAAEPLASEVRAVAERWWPGPLTLVVERRPRSGLHLGDPDSTVGLRVPDHDLVRAVAARVGPLAATSANRHGQVTPSTAAGVADELGEQVALVVDGGEHEGQASTVLDTTTWPWVVVRAGALSPDDVIAAATASRQAAG